MLNKNKLLNDNVFIWLGTFDEDLINNFLILAGGDVLLLKAIKLVNLNNPRIQEDILKMNTSDFYENYDINEKTNDLLDENLDEEKLKIKILQIITELKEGVRLEIYPPYLCKTNQKISEFGDLTLSYLHKIPNLFDALSIIEEIREHAELKIEKIRKERIEKTLLKLEKIKKILNSQDVEEFLNIQKDTADMRKKINAILMKFDELKEL